MSSLWACRHVIKKIGCHDGSIELLDLSNSDVFIKDNHHTTCRNHKRCINNDLFEWNWTASKKALDCHPARRCGNKWPCKWLVTKNPTTSGGEGRLFIASWPVQHTSPVPVLVVPGSIQRFWAPDRSHVKHQPSPGAWLCPALKGRCLLHGHSGLLHRRFLSFEKQSGCSLILDAFTPIMNSLCVCQPLPFKHTTSLFWCHYKLKPCSVQQTLWTAVSNPRPRYTSHDATSTGGCGL